MVINRIADRKPGWQAREAAEKKWKMTEDERKELLLEELKKERSDILCLALMYAKNFEETQEDITQRLITVNQNADLLQRVYNKGYEEGLSKGRELERERIKKGDSNIIGSRIISETWDGEF